MNVDWFRPYTETGNGIHLLPSPVKREWVIECDSCMTGGGAFTEEKCYTEAYTPEFTHACPPHS